MGSVGLSLRYGAARFSSVAFVQIRDFLFVNVAPNGLKNSQYACLSTYA